MDTYLRPPVFAGRFYPAPKEALEEQLTSLFAETKRLAFPGPIKFLLLPHAGIVFSGLTAAWGVRQLEKDLPEQIIILGVSHREWFSHAAVFPKGYWETPLGKVPVSSRLQKKITNQKEIISDPQPHREEHCLEVILPFLQFLLPQFAILPVLISQPLPTVKKALAAKLAAFLKEEKTLLIVSSDLSHYPPFSFAQKADAAVIKGIVTGKEALFQKAIKEVENAQFPGLETAACGQEAIGIALKAGEKIALKYRLVNYRNSGDSPWGEKDAVVGYAAIAGYQNGQNS
ncbi:AmmeMemoRadiSam system protein B [bacterium]|nr:AmmeMemoRadiSam system protein B [bacterium]